MGEVIKTRKVLPVATMFNHVRGGVTLSLAYYPYNKVEDGKSPVVWRIAHEGKRMIEQTGIFYTGDEWKEFCESNKERYRDDKKDLKKYFDDVLCEAINDLTSNNNFTFDSFKSAIGRGDKNSVNDAFRAKIRELEDSNKVGNASIYKGAYNALKVFAGYRKKRGKDKERYISEYMEKKYIRRGGNVFPIPEIDIKFNDITPKYLKEWETFLRDIETSVSYIAINMRTLRAIINNDGGKPYLTGDKYPFGKGKYIIPTGRRRNTYISIDDVWKMEDFKTDNHALMLGRDMFLFMFYGSGMNLGDVCRLRYSNKKRSEIVFIREKTANVTGDEPEPIHVPLIPPMIEIINRHGNKDQTGYIFPFLNGINPTRSNEARVKRVINGETRKINESLKIIADELELDPELSTNYARHSYMTHLLSEEMLNDIIVKQMVGHSVKDNVTAGYNHLTAKKRHEINSKLLDPNKKYTTIGTVKAI